MGSWISHQVSEFLARVTSYPDEPSALRGGIEHAGEALEAEVAAVMRDSAIVLSVGLADEACLAKGLVDALGAGESIVDVHHLGRCHFAIANLEDGAGTQLVVARAGDEPFGRDEQVLLDNMGRTMGLALRMLRTLDRERAALRNLEERQLLLERLARIQGSISHRAPLQQVLDGITDGVRELMDDDFAAIRLIDAEDPRYLLLSSASGLSPSVYKRVRRVGIEEGIAGRCIAEKKLCIFDNYPEAPGAISALVDATAMQTAMAVPLLVEGVIAGSLVTGSKRSGRSYTAPEQEMLKALAESASIALTDAKTVESMREARRTKDSFLTMVSHELKTPLTVMLGALHTLHNRSSELTDPMKEDLLVSALRRGEDLQRLIDMLLLGAQADLVGARERILLPAFIAEASRRSDVARSIRLTPPVDVTFWGDAVALYQILDILLDNAATHSPDASSIHIGASVTASTVSISVTNEGSLPPDLDVETLFAPFERGPEASSSGIGLGLYVARSLAESMEGRIIVRSANNAVVFTVEFPAKIEARRDLSALN